MALAVVVVLSQGFCCGQNFNYNAEFGSQCLYIHDNAECSGSPVSSACTDLREEETCISLRPLGECTLLDAEAGLYQNQTCVRWEELVQTTTNRTTTTTTTTTTQPPVCEDTTWEEHLGYLVWTDEWNFTCAEYEKYNWCSNLVDYSYSRNERGCTAAQACCFCGGGTTGGNKFVHADQTTQLPEYLEECDNYEFGIELPCRDADDTLCVYTCRNIEQVFCGTPEANVSGFTDGNLSAREACCMCGGGDLPPEPYLVYDTTTCTFFSHNITPDGLSDIDYDDEGFAFQISYSRSNPPACWTGLAFLIFLGVCSIAVIGFLIQRCADANRVTKITVDNRNRLPRQSVMEKNVEARRRELFQAEQKAEEDAEIERQRILRNQEADAWIVKAQQESNQTFKAKWQRDQERRNEQERKARAAAKVRHVFTCVLYEWSHTCSNTSLLWALHVFFMYFYTQSREERLARIAAFEAKHGADWEQKLSTNDLGQQHQVLTHAVSSEQASI